VTTNSALTEKYVFDGEHLPFADGSFEFCVSNWVIEHVSDPSSHFAEVARVLKPNGPYCFRTPNRWHYFTLGARLLPFRMHVLIANKFRGLRSGAHDPYPTFYRANTFGSIRKRSEQVGLAPVALIAIEKEPSYGRFHPGLFYPMFLYERVVNSSDLLEPFRASLLAILHKLPLSANLHANPRTND
jgi:SAM-dependent methyltransferase